GAVARRGGAPRSMLAGASSAASALPCAAVPRDAAAVIAGIAWVTASVNAYWWWRWSPPKRSLVLTARMRRILGAAAPVGLALAAVPPLLAALGFPLVAAAAVLVLTTLLTVIGVFLLLTGDLLMRPVEQDVRR